MEIQKPKQNKSVASNFVNAPAVYVGTYHKYNSGNIDGAWINLIGHDKESFAALCRELHNDEADPELMFQDFENFPAGFYGESGLEEGIWDWINLSEDDRELLIRYMDAMGYDDATIEQARDAFAGTASSEADFAEDLASESDAIPSDIVSWIVIDWQATWDCNLRHDYTSSRAEDGTLWFFRQ